MTYSYIEGFNFWTLCDLCGNLVGDTDKHTAWHQASSAPESQATSMLTAATSKTTTAKPIEPTVKAPTR